MTDMGSFRRPDLLRRLVMFQIDHELLDEQPELVSKMLSGFLIMHIESNVAIRKSTYYAVHPEAPICDRGMFIPMQEWTIVTLPDRISWRLTQTAGNGITKWHMARGFMLTSGLDEVGLQ